MTGSTALGQTADDLPAAAWAVAAGSAAEHAQEVDRAGRFPVEAVADLRGYGLLSAAAPAELGGARGMRELVTVAGTLAHGCSSTAMIWAMHQIQLACLTRHGRTQEAAELVRRVCAEQLLLASATSEVGVGGDIRTSRAALEPCGDGIRVSKDAPTVSYGAEADVILATVRRSPEAASNDQVLVVLPADRLVLEPTSEWDALGMRGTCSGGFRMVAQVGWGEVLSDPFGQIASQTMVPYSHLLWSACWTGIAEAALDRARGCLRQRAGASPGSVAVAADRLADAHGRLRLARAGVTEAARALDENPEQDFPERWSAAVALNALKSSVSDTAVAVVRDALTVCGFAGYAERGPFSVARHLRDVLSAPLMIANERLRAANGSVLYSRRDDIRPW
jgi:acyl-CoA dehydrogenase